MTSCSNCFLFDADKLHAEIGYFKRRRDMVVFILNVILNIQEFFIEYCKCDGENICLLCEIEDMFKKTQFAVYDSSLNLDFVNKVRENLHLKLLDLSEEHNHFVCKVINEKYFCEDENWFSGKKSLFGLDYCLFQWEKYQFDRIKNNQLTVKVDNLSTNNAFFKIMMDD